jgi:DNA-binding XRE family transcriptional regulator
MPVYCIRVGQHGPVKLGYAEDTDKRRHELQTAHWEDLHILRLWEGGEAEERMLHARFANLRLRREWFSFTTEMLGDVGLIEIVEPKKVVVLGVDISSVIADDPVKLGDTLRSARKSLDLTQHQVAAQTGIARSTIASIEAGHDMPGRAALIRLANLYRLPFDIQSSAA